MWYIEEGLVLEIIVGMMCAVVGGNFVAKNGAIVANIDSVGHSHVCYYNTLDTLDTGKLIT